MVRPGVDQLQADVGDLILTSLLWAGVLAAIIHHKLRLAATVLCTTAGLTLLEAVHSPLPENRLFLPFGPESWGELVLSPTYRGMMLQYAAGYLAAAGTLFLWGLIVPPSLIQPAPADDDRRGETAHADHAPPSDQPTANGISTRPILSHRVLEPEVMDTFEAAQQYDQMDHAAVNEWFVDDLLAGGEVGPDVMDLGTGTALIPIELCKRIDSVRVLAIDASAAMLDLARRRVEIAMLTDRVQLEQGDCKSLDGFADGMVDVVISNSLFHHLADPAQALRAAIRMLRGGGRLFIRDLVRPTTLGDVEHLVATHAADEAESARAMFRDSLLAALSLDEARQLFAPQGFSPDHVTMTSDRHWTFDATLSSS